MTDQHPITPPPKLVQQWEYQWLGDSLEKCGCKEYIATQAARWGADQELEACCQWLEENCGRWELPEALSDARRPQPQPSLKGQALAKIDAILSDPRKSTLSEELEALELSRRALELVPDDPADDGPVLYSEAMAAEDDDLLAGVTNASEPDINAEEAALIAAPSDRPLWMEMRDVFDPSRVCWSGHGFARELRVVADWVEVEAQSLARPESVAALLRAEADRATKGD